MPKPGVLEKLTSRCVASYPFSRGRTRLRRLAGGALVTEPFGGVWMRVSGVADFEWDLFENEGGKEPLSERILRDFLRPGMTFLDVGANVGYFSLLAASLVGRRGAVVSYEPTPEVARRLRENASLNGFAIQVREGAVADEEGSLTFFKGRSDSEGNSLYPDFATSPSFNVPAFTLDAEAARLGLQAVHMIKIDAEGAEPRVLRGARQVIERFKPVMLIEGNQRKLVEGGASIPQLRSQLHDMGYTTETLECAASADWGITLNLLAYPDTVALPTAS